MIVPLRREGGTFLQLIMCCAVILCKTSGKRSFPRLKVSQPHISGQSYGSPVFPHSHFIPVVVCRVNKHVMTRQSRKTDHNML